ncbi:MAG: bifunctional diaminohydroxyphosphoribosylaminopyrimidine deaminase/5-amino-6-(5-phosphoribosylamino)uracil reductase RibD [Hyphomonadaceae bacterium]|nr:bifunctional diaminohydroxyphosphoribosylaminopyrimidine deaminase/5-amino-6-(5-phosphoribosylamino)uracil reductase RibD [Hyphomonadaceae bacterium]
MKLAEKQAKKVLFLTGDNPRVGCVIVNDGKVVGQGFTQAPGEAHAEIMALNEAGAKAKGSTVFVTLEPCSFHGRTPPCADALVKASVRKVVIGQMDPHPNVSGNGCEILKQAGIEVETQPLSKKAKGLNRGFLNRMETGLPYVRVKLAQSLDGRTAMANGDSVWITGKKARQDVQVWRGRSQAILTGVDTVIHDDCRLTVRPNNLPKKFRKYAHRFDEEQPLRVILDTNLRTPPDAKILAHTGRTVIITATDDNDKIEALKNAGAEIHTMPKDENGRIDLTDVLKWLGQENINDLLVEAGATLAGQFISNKLANQLIVYTAPVLMGSSARPLLELDIDQMAHRHHIANTKVKKIGKDWRIIADL